MPINKETQTTVVAIVSHESKREFKKLAKKHHRTVSAHMAFLIEKALEEDKNKLPKSQSERRNKQ